MKKSLIIHLLVLIITMIVGWRLAIYLRAEQKSIDETKNQITCTSIAGIDKLVSEINWMLYVNYRGGEKDVNDENKQELYGRLDKIISANPNLEIAYTMGAAGLYPNAYEQSIKLLKRGCKAPHLSKSWKIPYMVAFYESQDFFRKIPRKVMQDSLKYYEMAMRRDGGRNFYIGSNYYRTLAKLSNEKDKHYALLKVLLDKWRETKQSSSGSAKLQEIQKRLIKACKDAITYSEHPATPRTLAFIEKIRKTVLIDEHVCPKCMTKYKAGEKFCSHCGATVKVYGICDKCQHVVHGDYCSNCGAKVKKR